MIYIYQTMTTTSNNVEDPFLRDMIQHDFKLNYTPGKPTNVHVFHLNETTNHIEITKSNVLLKTQPSSNLKLPTTYSLQSALAPILNQGNLGACVANAFALNIATQTNKGVMPSRLTLYSNCRILQNTPLNQDSGTDVYTANTAIQNYGVCQETAWPYTINKYKQFPPLSAYQASRFFKTFTCYYPTQTQASLTNALYTNQKPIVFGFLVYSSFMTQTVAKTGVVPVPNPSRETFQGGHCMNIIGYDNTNNWFVCANSWGTSWGNNGLCYIPYTYLLNPNLAFEFCQPTFVY